MIASWNICSCHIFSDVFIKKCRIRWICKWSYKSVYENCFTCKVLQPKACLVLEVPSLSLRCPRKFFWSKNTKKRWQKWTFWYSIQYIHLASNAGCEAQEVSWLLHLYDDVIILALMAAWLFPLLNERKKRKVLKTRYKMHYVGPSWLLSEREGMNNCNLDLDNVFA